MFKPRPRQAEVLAYRAGKMGVSAVPGSGKTHTLSALAAQIIASGALEDDQEVLIVTLVNSAVDNFSTRIRLFLKEYGLMPYLGYRVRTLHGLANDIIRERPALVGLGENFTILDEHTAEQARKSAGLAWLKAHPFALEAYLNPDLDEGQRDYIAREQLPDLVDAIALAFIRIAKDQERTPEEIRDRLKELPLPLPLAQMGAEIYTDYQQALAYRGAVDFDDLIRLALRALRADADFLERLRWQFPYILEDEAQDSSRLQEEILHLLTGSAGNWVRVGDPNQAIYETFTTATPEYLRKFMRRADVTARSLPNSGRSQGAVIWLANTLIEWVRTEHPVPAMRRALSKPYIRPAPKNDPQPNPPENADAIWLHTRKLTPEEEIRAVAESLARWLPENPEKTVAALVPRNGRGYELVEELKRRNIEYIENLRTTAETRSAAGILGNIVRTLADPTSTAKLSVAYRAWRRARSGMEEEKSASDPGAALLRTLPRVEEYLHPAAMGWLDELLASGEDPALVEELAQFGEALRRWQGAALLPIDQLILTLAQDLFSEARDLAVAYKLAGLLRQSQAEHPDWRLPEMTEELGAVARNERRLAGFSDDDLGFDPEQHKGKVVVATIHKAKGLEWDRVYVLSVNNYDFPSGMEYDRYISEKYYLRSALNLPAEALEQLKIAFTRDPFAWYEEGAATLASRGEYIAERLRLLYVAITRARRELILTWNTGRDGSQQIALPFAALAARWEEHRARTP